MYRRPIAAFVRHLSAMLIVVGIVATAAGQMPRAVITGPKESSTGDMIVLDASASEGLSRIWLLAVSPVPKSFLPVDSGVRCVFATGTAGKYVFVLVVAGANPNGGAAVEMATHEIVVKGMGPDNPPPPPPDDGAKNPFPPPAATLRTAAEAVAAVRTSRADATRLAELYDQARRLIESAPAARAAGTKPEIGTTSELREWLIGNGRQLGIDGRYSGLGEAVDRYLAAQLGTRLRDVTTGDAAALSALAWGIWEGGR